MKNYLAVGAVLCAFSFNSYAIKVSANYTNCSGPLTPAQCNSLDREIENEINSGLPDVAIDKYGSGMANSNSFAQKGLGSDYGDRFSWGLIKLAVGTAIQGDTSKLADNPESAEGLGIGAAATFGLNLDVLPVDKIGFLDLSKMDIFVSVGSYNSNSDSDGTESDLDIKSFSVMGRYQIIDTVDILPGNMLQWGGVSLHTGIHRSSMNGKLTQFFNDVDVQASGQTATISNTAATLKLDASTTTIPVEVSTYLRTVWALTFFGGAGFDFVTGDAEVSLDANGTAATGDGNYTTSITGSDRGAGDADPTNLRAFAGFQVNIPFVRLYTQVNKGLGNDLIGVNAGLTVLW